MGKYREADVRGWTAKRRIGSHSLRFGRLISLFIVCAYFFCFALFATQNVVQHLVVYLDILFFSGCGLGQPSKACKCQMPNIVELSCLGECRLP